MGTRGTITLIFKGKKIVMYNHFDSYPTGLGEILVSDIKALLAKMTLDDLVRVLDSLKIVTEGSIPSADDLLFLNEKYGFEFKPDSEYSWYKLLRHCQGSLKNTIESCYLLDFGNRNEEWNYILDFEKKKFSVKPGRYRRDASFDATFNIENIPNNWIDLLNCTS